MTKSKGRGIAVTSQVGAPSDLIDSGSALGGINRRGAERMRSVHNAVCRIRNIDYIVEISDVSRDGAQFLVRRGLLPDVHELVRLTFMDRPPVEARVVWSQGGMTGVKFATPLDEVDDAMFFDDLGSEYFRTILRLQRNSE